MYFYLNVMNIQHKRDVKHKKFWTQIQWISFKGEKIQMRPDNKSFSIQCCVARLKADGLSQRFSLI